MTKAKARKVRVKPKPTTDKYLLALVREVYHTLYRATESFEEDFIGADITYLVGAVINDGMCVWPKNRPLVKFMNEHFPLTHAIWNYLAVDEG